MSPTPNAEYLRRLSEALVSEIKAEMGRRGLTARGLALLIGENPQYVTSRIGAGNPRTGKRVEINISDLAAISGALETEPAELFRRARELAESDAVIVNFGESSDDTPSVDLAAEPSAAEPDRRDDDTGDDDA